MLYKSKKQDKYKISFAIVLMIVVLCSCVLIGSVAAWLQREYFYFSDKNAVGSVEMKIFANGTEVTGTTTTVDGKTTWVCNTPYLVSGNTALRSNVGLTIRNTGNIDALVRATISIYYIDDYDNGASASDKRPLLLVSNTPTVAGTASLDTTNWVQDFPVETVACGYMFYNQKLAPYILREPTNSGISETPVTNNEIKLVNQILLSEAQKNTAIYIDVTVDAVAYDGNIYKKMEEKASPTLDDIPVHALPFGHKENLPETWLAWR